MDIAETYRYQRTSETNTLHLPY